LRLGVTPRKLGIMWFARLTFPAPPAAANAASEGTNTVTPLVAGVFIVLVRFVEFWEARAEVKLEMPFVASVSEKETGTVKKLLGHESKLVSGNSETPSHGGLTHPLVVWINPPSNGVSPLIIVTLFPNPVNRYIGPPDNCLFVVPFPEAGGAVPFATIGLDPPPSVGLFDGTTAPPGACCCEVVVTVSVVCSCAPLFVFWRV
jgi:hypothetical protein